MQVFRDISEPIRKGLSWEKSWKSDDGGLIACWECGREKSLKDEASAQAAKHGVLMILPWRGGVDESIKAKKYGTYQYLAMWQGLRGESLDIDTNSTVFITCSKTNMQVIFTAESTI
jgi:hypothetical protein